MAPVGTSQPASRPTTGSLAVPALALIASAVAANTVWIFASQGLRGPGGGFFEWLLALLGGARVAASAALATGLMGAFLLYAARWQTMLGGPGLAARARRRVLVARVLLSVAVSAMLVAIPAHGFIYVLAWPAACEEFCGLPALLLLQAAGVVALVSGLAGLVLVRAAADLIFWVCVPLGIVAIVEPWLTLGWMQVPAVGVVLNTMGIAGLLVALAGLVRARPRAAAQST